MEQRLNHAVRLLKDSHRNISEAAFESGFESVSHFSRSFKARFGQAPLAFKQERLLNS
jgi:AraC-like DNA-binding protein